MAETALDPKTELTTLPRTGDMAQWTDAQKGLAEFVGMTTKIDNVVVIAPLGVREAYFIACERTQLDPIQRQIYLAYIGGKWLIIVGIDGFRLIAQRSKEYRGQDAPLWTDGVRREKLVRYEGAPVIVEGKPYMELADEPDWVGVWTDSKAPAACQVAVYREGFVKPVVGIATWAAYGKTSGQWKTNGPHMLSIRAEAQALRKAFPLELSGLYTIEEFDKDADNDNEVPTRDWKSELDATNLAGLTLLYDEFRTSGEWNPKTDAEFRARKATLVMEAEAEAATITVQETVNASE